MPTLSLVGRATSFFLRSYSKKAMAKSKFEYVRDFEGNDVLLPNSWIVVRIDGKGFHKFSDTHNFTKPNDIRSLELMNRAAIGVMEEFLEIFFAFGQSDEYSFVLKKNTTLYNRRASKLMTTITSLFTSLYTMNWSKHFDCELKYAPSFDGRCVLYPSDRNLIDYLSWRQADTHINNLHNTTFWNLVQKSNMTTTEADKFLSGTVSADKNEILFSRFNINYNDEAAIFKKGTILLKKEVTDPNNGKNYKVIVNLHEDLIKEKFWQTHWELLQNKSTQKYELPTVFSQLVLEQLEKKRPTK